MLTRISGIEKICCTKGFEIHANKLIASKSSHYPTTAAKIASFSLSSI
jgi:hypothetical protein